MVKLPVPTKKLIRENVEIVNEKEHMYLIKHPLIVGHPLNFSMFLDAYDLKTQLEDDVKNGYIELIPENRIYDRMLREVERTEPRLLSTFMVYDAIAKGERVDDHAILVALKDLDELIDIEEKITNPDHANKFRKLVNKVRTASNKVVAFDRLIQEIHFDPDFLRHLPIVDMLYLATIINYYLDLLRYGSGEKLLKMMETYMIVDNADWYIQHYSIK